MATESSEGEEDAKLMRGNQPLIVDDDLREMGKKPLVTSQSFYTKKLFKKGHLFMPCTISLLFMHYHMHYLVVQTTLGGSDSDSNHVNLRNNQSFHAKKILNYNLVEI
ncbi:anaphase-promoting complex subunit 10 [Pyrus ussuriensis x Pyrus communis]|uniref:Anaphase-promoting complex subunit 10 n=1 Tax=Pyrus ussuriensis x Pyrus communis TaxID=2448454 RepID=A0A5N5ICD2_9ROSA|nr:anaphase-promoting complex subunit 10 [Pyrus ussuriensis x Pyrus communis]